jgi:D-3-phosphoglycerate dehydrogenase
MPEWKIIVTDDLHEKGLELLRAGAHVDYREDISREELLQIIEHYDAMVVRSGTRVTAELIQKAGRLKVIGRAGVGLDNIDLAAATTHKITVVNAPMSTTIAVAEHTLALMLALARAIPRADAGMKSGQWLKPELQGVELNGKVLGIIGMGNIGSEVARRAANLGMHVVGHDPEARSDEFYEVSALPVSLPDLYAQADFISIHVPLTIETRGMIDGQAFARMRRGVRLISTARGGIIDETALLGALEAGQVAGAALDVFAKEPPGMSALVTHPNVIATPHIGAQTSESQERAAVDIAQEVLASLGGEPLRWKVV